MPELPEVEFTRRCLRRWAGAGRLEGITLGAHATSDDKRVMVQAKDMVGCPIQQIHRRGKYLFVDFGELGLSVHLGMTGKWVLADTISTRAAHVRLILDFTHCSVAFVDVRKFGYVHVQTETQWHDSLVHRRVGPDLFDTGLTAYTFHETVCRGRVSIKTALLDQRRVSGVGNIYACEALHVAGIDPRMPSGGVAPALAGKLLNALRTVMEDSLARESGEEIFYLTDGNPENPFLVYGRAGQCCNECDGMVEKITQNARTTFFCPTCLSK